MTIAAGVVVRSGGNDLNGSSPLTVRGTLNVLGTEAEPVVLTSLFDDERGGDINGDAPAIQPIAGNWGGIVFETDSVGDVQFAEIYYALDGIKIDGGKPTIDHLTVEDARLSAISALPHDVFKVTDLRAKRAGVNGILIRAGVIEVDTTWDADAGYRLMGDVSVEAGATLTIGAGVAVKSGGNDASGTWPLKVRGTLNVQGTSAKPVVFTSVFDHERAPTVDTTFMAFTGNWGGIQFEGQGSGELDYLEVYYATTGILADGTSPTVSHAHLSENKTGFLAMRGATPVLTDSEIVDNTTGAIAELGATLDAKNNYWGAPDGPGGEAAGSGSPIKGDVTYEPFKDAP